MSYTVSVQSIPSAIAETRKEILSKLQANNFAEEDVFAIHLALEEAFLNAVRHGNKMDTAKKVTIGYTVDSDKIEISITDQGEGFDPQVIPDPREGENLYKAQGRGLLLIRSYMDTVEYNLQGNCVKMVKHRSG